MIKLIIISKHVNYSKLKNLRFLRNGPNPPPPPLSPLEITMQVKCDINVGKCISQTTNIFINYEYMC